MKIISEMADTLINSPATATIFSVRVVNLFMHSVLNVTKYILEMDACICIINFFLDFYAFFFYCVATRYIEFVKLPKKKGTFKILTIIQNQCHLRCGKCGTVVEIESF